ncbi:pentatricopeptide repeat-containing protein 1, mitochondrial [Leptinotarsa decemlineata]|uniref:pentatricopeptide repeat-containing protein 1, mitochondrial n=1 Tax=Leptinotarsa decemlineata TaxID=7539 RepID=UPI003D30596D
MFRSKLIINVARKQLFRNVVIKKYLRTSHSCVFQRASPVSCSNNIKEHVLSTTQQSPKIKNIQEGISEKEFLVKLKTDPDTFGSQLEQEIVDEGDLEEEKYLTVQPSPSQQLRTKQYADLIKDLIKKRKIKEAIDLVEVRMIKEDRVKPDSYIYNLLLGACGRVGYTKKAFMLFNSMKKRGLKATGGTYTALFNACANSPWPTTDGLTRATNLRELMLEKGYEPNDTNYNAMIKAFGRCGDLPSAFSLVDEMIVKGIPVKDDTICFLLNACITDKEAGFRHALLVWRKLVDKNIQPSVFTFNLMLRTIRDCGLGDTEVANDVIKKLVDENKQTSLENSDTTKLLSATESTENEVDQPIEHIDPCQVPEIESSTILEQQVDQTDPSGIITDQHEDDKKNCGNIIEYIESIPSRPNLMAKVPHLGNIISLSEVTKPEERLLLVGGCKGFLQSMKDYACQPDIKTFTLLLDSIPGTIAAEEDLMTSMRKSDVRPDIDFYNMLLKKRSIRFDYESGKAVVNLMARSNFKPDLITYGILALGCKTKKECMELVEEMKLKCYRLNAEILGAMLHKACFHLNISYVLYVMELCHTEQIEPNRKFMERLETFRKECKDLSNNKKLSKVHEKLFSIFRARYKVWKEQVTVDESEDAHPWQQFRQTSDGDTKFKVKDTARFKPRHTSLFKVKTSTKVRY